MTTPLSQAVTFFLNSKEFNRLLIKGKDQSFITAEEINDALPAGIVLASDVDEIMNRIIELKIDVTDAVVEEEEDEEGIRLDGTEIIEEALSREEKAELRSASTDPVKHAKAKLLLLKKLKKVKEKLFFRHYLQLML
jgi:RNA polymerase primary sigma factor